MKVSELKGSDLDYWVARALGWTRTGDNDHCKPKHKPSLDYPGETIDDWGSKGPHPRLISPTGEEFYLCECDKGLGALPGVSNDWSHGGPIIEEHEIAITPVMGGTWEAGWNEATGGDDYEERAITGPTPLVAAMRAVVAMRFGSEVSE